MQDLQVQLVRPPVPVRPAVHGRVRDRAPRLGLLVHVSNDGVVNLRHGNPSQVRAGRDCRRWSSGAHAPVDDLGLVDRVAVVRGSGQAGCVTDGAVDVCDGAARPAHDVVVVVGDPRLVAGHRAGRLDAPHEPGGGQRTQDVVDRLMGDLAEVRTDHADDRVRVGVRAVVHRREHRHPRPGHP